MKEFAVFLFAVVLFFFFGGGFSYFFYAYTKTKLSEHEYRAVSATPLATFLMLVQFLGLWMIYKSAGVYRKNGNHACVWLLLGFLLLMFAWHLLDGLLYSCYG